MRALDRHGRVAAVPFQKPGVPEAAGLTREECRQAVWAVEPTGRRYRGAGAINAALAWALGIPLLLRLYDVALVRRVEDAVYAWVAAHRGRLPGVTPYCQEHPDVCAEE